MKLQKIDEMNESSKMYKGKPVEKIKKVMGGYIGNDFANVADDNDIVDMLELKDEHAKMYNQYMKPIVDKINTLRKKYKLKPMRK